MSYTKTEERKLRKIILLETKCQIFCKCHHRNYYSLEQLHLSDIEWINNYLLKLRNIAINKLYPLIFFASPKKKGTKRYFVLNYFRRVDRFIYLYKWCQIIIDVLSVLFLYYSLNFYQQSSTISNKYIWSKTGFYMDYICIGYGRVSRNGGLGINQLFKTFYLLNNINW